MDDVQVKKLAQIAHRKKVPAGQTIISDEEPVDFFANVLSGAIKLTKTLPDGRQQIVGLLFAPDFLGRAYSKNNPYTAEAATDVEICTFPNAAFERLVGEYPGRSLLLVHMDLFRLRSPDDLLTIGFQEYLDRRALVAVEWPERAGDLMPPGTIWVEITLTANARTRRIEVRG
jgi:CRP/FNR family transcriptional regulator